MTNRNERGVRWGRRRCSYCTLVKYCRMPIKHSEKKDKREEEKTEAKNVSSLSDSFSMRWGSLSTLPFAEKHHISAHHYVARAMQLDACSRTSCCRPAHHIHVPCPRACVILHMTMRASHFRQLHPIPFIFKLAEPCSTLHFVFIARGTQNAVNASSCKALPRPVVSPEAFANTSFLARPFLYALETPRGF